MTTLLLLFLFLSTTSSKQIPEDVTSMENSIDGDLWSSTNALSHDWTVACERDSMHITVPLSRTETIHSTEIFNGIVYPAGLGSNSSCLREYIGARGLLQYTLPLTGCNTMAIDNDDGTVEYYNTLIVQPHLRLVTGQGRGFDVRCKYRRRDVTNYRAKRPRAERLRGGQEIDEEDEFDEESGLLPAVIMKIYKGDPKDKVVASNVRIGDDLTLVISLEKQKKYGLLVSECAVKDGLGWAEQNLIANDGCPLDGEIMGLFKYVGDKQEARVSFPAHRFPYTASVYYTCAVKLCELAHPTDCVPCEVNSRNRKRRQTEGSPALVEVFSGLYVNEADSLDDDDVFREKKEDEICISQRQFALAICIAGVILMICAMIALACLLSRRRKPKTYSRTGSSLYSGPYTNTGYSHTS